MSFRDHPYGQFVRTWDTNVLLDVCISGISAGSIAELTSLSRIVHSVIDVQMTVSGRGVSPSLLRVLSDDCTDRDFLCTECTTEVFLRF